MKTIGIKLADGSFYPVLQEGTRVEKQLELTTANNNQTRVMVDVYRSKTCSIEDAEYVDTLQIDNLVAHPNGQPDITFTISLDEDNNLFARIVDEETGAQSKTTITLVSRTIEERLVPDSYEIKENVNASAAVKKVAGGGLLAAAMSINSRQKEEEEEEIELPDVIEEDETISDIIEETSVDESELLEDLNFDDIPDAEIEEQVEEVPFNQEIVQESPVIEDTVEMALSKLEEAEDTAEIVPEEETVFEAEDTAEIEVPQSAEDDALVGLDLDIPDVFDDTETAENSEIAETVTESSENADTNDKNVDENEFGESDLNLDDLSLDLPEEPVTEANEDTLEDFDFNTDMDLSLDISDSLNISEESDEADESGEADLFDTFSDTSEASDSLDSLPDFDFGSDLETSSDSAENTLSDDDIFGEIDTSTDITGNLFSTDDLDSTPDFSAATTFAGDDMDVFNDDNFDDLSPSDYSSSTSSNDTVPLTGPISFTGLYDTDDLEEDVTEEKKKTKVPVIICIICAMICIIAVVLILFVIPSKYNLFKKNKKEAPAPVVVVEPEYEEPEYDEFESEGTTLSVLETSESEMEPEIEEIPQAREDEVVIIEEAEKVVPELPPVVEEIPEDIMYKIKWGDTLWDISDTYYKNPWKYRFLANYNRIPNPDHIVSGTIIAIPAASE